MSGGRAGTLVAIATTAERAALLPECLGSLRPQCERLHVYLNGHAKLPECVLDLCDVAVRSLSNQGADRKFWWAHEHAGIYLSCDDDFIYPPNYVETLAGEVERLGGRALVTAHGATYPARPRDVSDYIPATLQTRVPIGRWVNHAGTGALAWDAGRIRVPLEFPVPNRSDVQLSSWANRQRIPIWTVAHEPGWLRPLPHAGGSVTKDCREERHRTVNRLLAEHGEWKVHVPSQSS